MLVMLCSVFLHLHPVQIRKSGMKCATRGAWAESRSSCFSSLTFTGLLLMFYYRPTLEYAYIDIVDLREQVPLGIMREIHRWGAHAMVIAVWLHMYRVFMTGSYKPPREFNWNVGVILLVLTLLLSFTGYLLPWDQLAIWAITVGATWRAQHRSSEMKVRARRCCRLGDIPLINAPATRDSRCSADDSSAKARCCASTCCTASVCRSVAGFLMAIHFWRIRRDGGISGPL